jgi:hypothetical protein
MIRFSSVALTLCLTILLAGCSSSSGSSGGASGGGSSPFVPGKWTVTTFSSLGFLASPVEFDLNLAQSGNTISSNSENTVDNAACAGMHVDTSTGTVTGNQFNLVLDVNSETITVTGTLSADGKSIVAESGAFTSSPGGPCLNGEHGGIIANFVPPFTGTLTGTMQVFNVLGEPGVTAMFTEDPSFSLSGSMIVINDPCFSTLATKPDNPGISIGSLSSFEMTDGTNIVDFVGHILTAGSTLTFEYDANWSVTAGCTEESGVITLDPGTLQAAASVSAASISKASASTINPVLVERFKALLAARHEHENDE